MGPAEPPEGSVEPPIGSAEAPTRLAEPPMGPAAPPMASVEAPVGSRPWGPRSRPWRGVAQDLAEPAAQSSDLDEDRRHPPHQHGAGCTGSVIWFLWTAELERG